MHKNKKIKQFVKYFFSVIIAGYLISFITYPNIVRDFKALLLTNLYSIFIGLPLWYGNMYITKRVGLNYNWEEKPTKRIILTIIFVILYSSFVTLIVNFLLFYFRTKSLNGFWDSSINLIGIEIFISVYIFTVFTGVSFFQMWKKGLEEKEALQRKTVEFQLESLRNQVNPHFLFNSLNCLVTLIPTQPNEAVQFVEKLSDVYRYVLDNRKNNTVKWKVERKFVENYLDLQRMRFGNSLLVKIDVEENQEFEVVPLSVQMLVENSVKHNIITREKPLTIEIYSENNYLIVRNNKQERESKILSSSLGLENIAFRYQYIYKSEIIIENNENYFTVKLPMNQFVSS